MTFGFEPRLELHQREIGDRTIEVHKKVTTHSRRLPASCIARPILPPRRCASRSSVGESRREA